MKYTSALFGMVMTLTIVTTYVLNPEYLGGATLPEIAGIGTGIIALLFFAYLMEHEYPFTIALRKTLGYLLGSTVPLALSCAI